jgi:carboxypeptidase family protein
MSFSAPYLPAVLLTIFTLPTSLWAQTTPKQVTKAPRSSISGRVTIKEKGAAGVVVVIERTDFINRFEPLPKATTDQDGFYRIANVAPGTYQVAPSAPPYVSADFKERVGKNVLVGEDENIENINFALLRGGVITGRVTDSDSRPVIQQQVQIYRVEVVEQRAQQRQVSTPNGGQTDDRGIYRVFGLAPGRYTVAVGRSEEHFITSYGPNRSMYKQVFHPDVSDQAKATVIEVGEGTEATNVDIVLGRTMQTFAVSGRVIESEKSLPAPNIRLGMRRIVGKRADFVSLTATTNTQGDFVIEGLVPGKYVMFLFPNQSGGRRAENISFDIIDQDVSGLSIKLLRGASLSGVVVLEGENKAGPVKFSELQLRALVPHTGVTNLGSSASSPIAPDGSFMLSGLSAGTVNIMLGALTNSVPIRALNIARVERDGVLMPRVIEIKDDEQVTGVRVVLVYGNATLRGVVNIENGTLPAGARIFVRLARPGEPLVNIREPQVDARGHFLAENLPAGTYEIYAYVVGVQMRQRTVKREVSLQDGITTDVVINIDMSAAPEKP